MNIISNSGTQRVWYEVVFHSWVNLNNVASLTTNVQIMNLPVNMLRFRPHCKSVGPKQGTDSVNKKTAV